MTAYILVRLVDILANVLVVLVIVDSILSYFMSPFHPLRMTLDKIVQPMLRPIRRIIPLLGGLDFSPLILIIIIELISYLFGIAVFSIIR